MKYSLGICKTIFFNLLDGTELERGIRTKDEILCNYTALGGTHIVQQITISISKNEKQGPNAAHFSVGRCLLSARIDNALNVRVE